MGWLTASLCKAPLSAVSASSTALLHDRDARYWASIPFFSHSITVFERAIETAAETPRWRGEGRGTNKHKRCGCTRVDVISRSIARVTKSLFFIYHPLARVTAIYTRYSANINTTLRRPGIPRSTPLVRSRFTSEVT